MSIFFVFALIGLISFLVAVAYRREKAAKPQISQGSEEKIQFVVYDGQTDGDVTIVFTKRWAARVLIVSGLLALAGVVVFWPALRAPNSPETQFQEFLGSRFVGTATFGWCFGVLFGYWFSSVLFRNPEDKPSYKEIAVGVVMTLLLLVGIGGQQVISKFLSRLTSFEIAGAKIDLDPAGVPKSLTASQTYSPLGRPQSQGPDQSQGLYLIEQLLKEENGQIDRDRRYVSMIIRTNGIRSSNDTDTEFVTSLRDLKKAFGPLMSCMSVFYDRTGDDGRVWQLLSPLASGMRKFALEPKRETTDPSAPSQWEDAFWSAADNVRRELPLRLDELEHAAAIPSRCAELPQKDDKVRADYLKDLRRETWRTNPYFSLIIAGMFAYGHEYEPSILLLEHVSGKLADVWAPELSQSEVAKRIVYNIRLRGAIVSYMEEWLHGFNAVKPTSSLLDYQLSNLTKEIDDGFKHKLFDTTLMPAARVMQSVSDEFGEMAGFRSMPRDDDPCDKPQDFSAIAASENDWRDSLFLARALVSAKLSWITVALDNPSYFELYQKKANEDIDELKQLRLSCFKVLDREATGSGASDAVKLKTKDVLEAYARITYANYVGTEKNRELTSDDSKIDKLERAEQAVILAESVMQGISPDSTSAFLKPLAGNTAYQSQLDLEMLSRAIRAAIAEVQR